MKGYQEGYEAGAAAFFGKLLTLLIVVTVLKMAYQIGVTVERERQAEAVAEQSSALAIGGAVVIEKGNGQTEVRIK